MSELRRLRRAALLGTALAVLGAAFGCSGSVDDDEGGGGGSGAGPGAIGGSSAIPGGGAGSASVPGGGLQPPGTCVPGIPGSSQIPRLLNRQYEAVVRDLLGVTSVGSDSKPASQLLVDDFDGPMTPDAWRIYQDVGAQIARAVMAGQNKAMFISCDPAAAGCMDQTIRSFGRKAFRRPLTDAEVARFQ